MAYKYSTLLGIFLPLAGCGTGETGLLVTVYGEGVSQLELHLARDGGGRWRQDPTIPKETLAIDLQRDLASGPFRVMVVPGGNGLDQVLAVEVLGLADGKPRAIGGRQGLKFVDGKVVTVDIDIVGPTGAGPFSTDDRCFCADGLPWLSMADAQCEALVPAGPVAQQAVPACDGQVSPGELRGDRLVPCFTPAGGACRAGTRTCVDGDRVAFDAACQADGASPEAPVKACDDYRGAPVCTDPILALWKSAKPMDISPPDPCDPVASLPGRVVVLPFGTDLAGMKDAVALEGPNPVAAATPTRVKLAAGVPVDLKLSVPLLIDGKPALLVVTPRGLVCPGRGDFAVPADLSVVQVDGGTGIADAGTPIKSDLSVPADLARPTDLAVPLDLYRAADLVTPLDLYLPPAMFAQPVAFQTPGVPSSLAAGDLDGDLADDLLVGTSTSCALYRGTANGFVAQPALMQGAVSGVGMGLVDGDKLPDPICGQSGSQKYLIFPNLGALTFGGAVGNNTTGLSPSAFFVIDFGNDLLTDLVAANGGNNGIGAGTFLPGKGQFMYGGQLSLDGPVNPTSLAVADFNGDKLPDVVFGSSGGALIYEFLNNGMGGFVTAKINTLNEPRSVATGDFNGDLVPDLAVTSAGGNAVQILLGAGPNGFRQAINVAVAGGPHALALGDFNHDKLLDFAALCDSNGAAIVDVRLGRGDGNFNLGPLYQAGMSAAAIAGGDFENDGKRDLVVANSAGLLYFRGQ
jgi:FG-GAP-like repeat